MAEGDPHATQQDLISDIPAELRNAIRSIDTARTSVTADASTVRLPESNIDTTPNMSAGPMISSSRGRPSCEWRPILTLPEVMM